MAIGKLPERKSSNFAFDLINTLLDNREQTAGNGTRQVIRPPTPTDDSSYESSSDEDDMVVVATAAVMVEQPTAVQRPNNARA